MTGVKKTNEVFIEEMKRLYPDYDFSKVNYLGAHKAVTLICDKGHTFADTASNLSKGRGCSICRNINRGLIQKDQILKRFIEVHGDFYDYTSVPLTLYMKDTIVISCPHHGNYLQKVKDHARGSGCIKCHLEKSSKNQRLDSTIFVAKARSVHGDKYDYSKVVYELSRLPVIISCKEHGDFLQTPNNHLRGKGCSSCASSGFNACEPCSLYVISIADSYLKCGISVDVKSRLKKLENKCKLKPFKPLYCVDFADSILARDLENILKSTFKRSVVPKELMLDGFTETYNMSDIGEILRIVSQYSALYGESFYNFTNDLSG